MYPTSSIPRPLPCFLWEMKSLEIVQASHMLLSQCSPGPLSGLWEHVWQQCLRLVFSGGPWEDPLLPFLGPGCREGVLTPSLPATRLFLVSQGQPGSEQAQQSPAQAAFAQQKGINLLLPYSRGSLLPPASLQPWSSVQGAL